MKILLVHDYGTATGGAELQMLTLRRHLRARGHDARLFSSRAELVPGAAPVESEYSCFGTTSKLQVLSQAFNPSAYVRLRAALRAFQPDVVHVRMFLWQLSPAILPLLAEVPSLYQTATYKAICPKGTKLLPDGRPCHVPPGVACLRNRCLTVQSWGPLMLQQQLWLRGKHVFRRIVALSGNMRTRLQEAGIGPVQVIHNGVPERLMRPPLQGSPTVAFAGRLVPEKGLPVLLEAMRQVVQRLPEARLWIAGHGPERAAVEAAIHQKGLGGHVAMLGHLSREELERRLDATWVQTAPSLWDEPFGNVATESLMRGTAMVASANGGFAEIVTHGQTGLLVPPGDAGALGEALLRLLSNRELAESMGKAGRQRALEEFSESRCVDKFLLLYREMLEESRG